MTSRPLRILCLHGYRQDEHAFREKLGAFRKMVKRHAELSFVNAPLKVPSLEKAEDGVADDQGFGWWFSSKQAFNAHQVSDLDDGFEESVRTVKQAVDVVKPDGVLAFSQGAALLVLLCAMQQEYNWENRFQFAIFVAAFRSRSSKHSDWYEKCGVMDMPSLHVIGDTDKVIERELSEDVLSLFEDPVVLRHPGGHFVPATGKQKDTYLIFLDKMKAKVGIS